MLGQPSDPIATNEALRQALHRSLVRERTALETIGRLREFLRHGVACDYDLGDCDCGLEDALVIADQLLDKRR